MKNFNYHYFQKATNTFVFRNSPERSADVPEENKDQTNKPPEVSPKDLEDAKEATKKELRDAEQSPNIKEVRTDKPDQKPETKPTQKEKSEAMSKGSERLGGEAKTAINGAIHKFKVSLQKDQDGWRGEEEKDQKLEQKAEASRHMMIKQIDQTGKAAYKKAISKYPEASKPISKQINEDLKSAVELSSIVITRIAKKAGNMSHEEMGNALDSEQKRFYRNMDSDRLALRAKENAQGYRPQSDFG